jgi:hypothetical protein
VLGQEAFDGDGQVGEPVVAPPIHDSEAAAVDLLQHLVAAVEQATDLVHLTLSFTDSN